MVNGILGFGNDLNQQLGQGALNNPLLQLGTNLLQAGGPTPGFSNFGQSLGRAFDATSSQINSQRQNELRQRLVEAQIANFNRPAAVKAPTAQTDLGKLQGDLNKGLITQEDFNRLSSAEDKPDVETFSSVTVASDRWNTAVTWLFANSITAPSNSSDGVFRILVPST